MSIGISERPRTSIRYRKLGVPRNSGAALIVPPLSASGELMQANRLQLASSSIRLLGRSLSDLTLEARRHLVSSAVAYTGRYREVANGGNIDDASRLVLAGHQPNLFHAGVWFKNFALNEIAQSNDAIGINLLIDNDVVGSPFLSVPTGSLESPEISSVPFDAAGPVVPFEQRSIVDSELFDSFGSRVADRIRPLIEHPLIEHQWPYAIEARSRLELRPGGDSANLGQCLAESRHRMESDWGLETLEVPLSHVCDSRPFHDFAGHILHHIGEFHQHYNDAVLEYRKIHGLRSQSHPVPLLGIADGWFEAPFWVWSDDEPTRRPLFVRREGASIRLRAGRQGSGDRLHQELSFAATGDQSFGRALLDAMAGNPDRASRWKLRPRALMTTMYARLCLSDLFLHGIGGSKYDQVTDVIMERFFGVAPPEHYTLTATLHLPLKRPHVESDDIRRINGLIRELWFHPEQATVSSDCLEAGNNDFLRLAKEKKRLLSALPPRGHRRAWHLELQRINTQFRTLVASCSKDLLVERERLHSQLRKDTLLSSREYAFCLFPTESISRTLLDLCCTKP